jgi:putative PIG3 family NAD(P)H quinone oxidoreductase
MKVDQAGEILYPATMRAVICDGFGDESVLRVAEVDEPVLTPGGVRIRVATAGVNRADLLQRRGLYPPPDGASAILGLECAGTVVEVGAEVGGLRPGDHVMALLTGGGYAEQVVAPAGCVMAAPAPYSSAEAGAFPEVYLTAFLNLFVLGGLEPGKLGLVHGGSGGVGTAAIQLAAAAGAPVLVTAGSPERCRRCLSLGALGALDHRRVELVPAVLEASRGRAIDVVLDCIGASYLADHLRLLAPDGRLILIGLMGGASAEIDLARLLSRRLSIIGSTLRSRSTTFKAATIAALRARFGREIDDGAIRPVVDRVLPIEAVADAHRLLASGEIFGKLVLEL